MTDGKADIWINVITPGHPAISELAISTDLVFLPQSDEVIKKLENTSYRFLADVPEAAIKTEKISVMANRMPARRK